MSNSDSRLHSGRVLCGKWRLDSMLGEGGMATVWSGEHRNGLKVAIKVLKAELGADATLRERFLREGYVANRIEHPGVLRVLDDDVSDDGVVFLVMDLLKGETLRDHWLERERILSPNTVRKIAIQILEVLAVAHTMGIVHRDLKPDNVFLLDDGGIKLLDFGIARLREVSGIDQKTRTGAMLGTPAFMPPEQALGHWDRVDCRSDLFAVGASMWTLLTGELVHKATTMQELLVAAATKPPESILKVVPTLPVKLAQCIDKALQFEMKERWASALDMKAALEKMGEIDDEATRPYELPPDRLGAHGSWQSVVDPVTRVETQKEVLWPRTPVHGPVQGPRTRGSTAPMVPLMAAASRTTSPVASESGHSEPRRRWPVVIVAAGGVLVLAAGVGAVMSSASREPLSVESFVAGIDLPNPIEADADTTAAPSAEPSASSSSAPRTKFRRTPSKRTPSKDELLGDFD